MKKVLSLYSSARANGNTFQLVSVFNQLVPGEVIFLDDLNIAQYDYEFSHQDDDFVSVIDKMLVADVVIFASPVYWYSLTPAFRRFIDRFSDLLELPYLKIKGKQLREKSFYLFATSAHPELPCSFTSQIAHTLQYLQWPYSGSVHLDCMNGFDESAARATLAPLASVLTDKTVAPDKAVQQSYAELLCQFK